MIVRFTLCVGNFKMHAADLADESIAVGLGWIDRVRRPLDGRAELPRVDERVEAVGQNVAFHARRNALVADDLGQPPGVPPRFRQEDRQAVGVVDVSVGIDRRVDALSGIAAHFLENALLRDFVGRARVDQNAARVGFDDRYVRKALVESHAVRDFLNAVERGERVAAFVRGLVDSFPQPVGKLLEGRHEAVACVTVRSRPVPGQPISRISFPFSRRPR